jgi:hypothetical protein
MDSFRNSTDMARLASLVDARSGQPGLLAVQSADSKSWTSTLRFKCRSLFDRLIPVGYQDEDGFHYGNQSAPRRSDLPQQ